MFIKINNNNQYFYINIINIDAFETRENGNSTEVIARIKEKNYVLKSFKHKSKSTVDLMARDWLDNFMRNKLQKYFIN